MDDLVVKHKHLEIIEIDFPVPFLVVLRLNVPVNNFSVMSGRISCPFACLYLLYVMNKTA